MTHSVDPSRPDGQTQPSSLSVPSATDETLAVPAPDAPGVPAFSPPSEPGEVGRLGPYRVVKELGRGGMGSVYAAIDTRLDRQLALKVMLPKFAADPAAKERFLREARAAAKISHDNVVTVYEADERDGVPYIAMQFLKGCPLDEYLRKNGNPTIPQTLRIARETAAGLAAAHELGLVHRDIKPGNLWLEAPDGRVKVLDFGLAKAVDSEVELTNHGAVVGTPAYMSPEQARGEKVDHRTDLFSLGGVLYRLCAGRLPFEGPSTMAVLMALATEEPTPVRERNPEVPEPLAALIHQLLVKKAAARPQTANEVVRRIRTMEDAHTATKVFSTSDHPPVIWEPMPVRTDANPFADIDATESDPVPAAAPATAPKRSGGGWGKLAGVAALLTACVVAGVIIIIKNKDGTETKIAVPDTATVTIKSQDGKELAQVGPTPKTAEKGEPNIKKPAGDPPEQAKVARWLLDRTNSLLMYVEQDGKRFEVRDNKLPSGPFRVVRLLFDPADKSGGLTEADFHKLAALTDLEELTLDRKPLTDAALESLLALKNLRRLRVHFTRLTPDAAKILRQFPKLESLHGPSDDGWLKNLAGKPSLKEMGFFRTTLSPAIVDRLREFPNLTGLEFEDCAVAEGALRMLAGIKSLRLLSLKKTTVTPEQVSQLGKEMPWCEVRLIGADRKLILSVNPGVDGGIIEPKK